MQAHKDVFCNVGMTTQRGVGRQHGMVTRRGIVAERRVVVEQNTPTDAGRVAENGIGANDRASANHCGRGYDRGGVDEREKLSAPGGKRLGHPATDFYNADGQHQAIAWLWNVDCWIGKDRQVATRSVETVGISR